MTNWLDPINTKKKVTQYRKKKEQTGMILTHDKKTGKLVKFRFVYEIK